MINSSNFKKFINDLNNLNNNEGFFGLFSLPGNGKGFSISRYCKSIADLYENVTDINYRHYWMTLNILGKKHRSDNNVSLLIANFLDVDTLEGGVKPQLFIKKVLAATNSKDTMQNPFLVPTIIQNSGHGAYLIYLYRNVTPATPENVSEWRATETGLVNGLDKLTQQWFGKSLADPKSTNPSRLLRMPETWNVKYLSSDNSYTKPVKSYIVTINNKRYSLDKLNHAIKTFIPSTKDSDEKLSSHQTSDSHPISNNSHPISKGEIKVIDGFLSSKMGMLINEIAKSNDSINALEVAMPYIKVKSKWLANIFTKILRGFKKGTRNSSTLTLASQLLITGCKVKAMRRMVIIANSNSQPPMKPDEVDHVIIQAVKYRLDSIELLNLDRKE